LKIAEIKEQYRIEDIVSQYISLKKQGTELVGNCLFHDDNKASLKVNPVKQKFKCFACGASGDVLNFIELQGHTTKEAMTIISSNSIVSGVFEKKQKDPEVKWIDAIPNQDTLPDVSVLKFATYGEPSSWFAYKNENGDIFSYVLRYDLGNGKKDVIPYTFKTNGTQFKWMFKGMDIKRKLYNLDQIVKFPDKPILLVEGEKTADSGVFLYPHLNVTTWVGGADGIHNADFSPLIGKTVICWPDNDVAGVHAMFGGWKMNEKTGVYLRKKGITEIINANFKAVKNSPDFPPKWDIADANWSKTEALTYMTENTVKIPVVSEVPPNNEKTAPAPTPVPTPAPTPVPTYKKPKEEPVNVSKNSFFICVGHENTLKGTVYVFFNYRTNSVIKLAASGFTSSTILQLAPLSYWEQNYPKNSNSGIKFDLIILQDHLTSICSQLGIFDNEKIRGRGAWIEGESIVIHCGSYLIVDGQTKRFSEHKSKYIYESRQDLGFDLTEPISKSEASKLYDLINRLNWSRAVESKLLAGWVVVAPFCGALNWRPHLWLTGASGSGKSEVMDMFINRFMGQMSISAQGETTSSGIRQFLRSDALPVMFDEAESETKSAKERMNSVLELMRASSTSSGSKIYKGSANGDAMAYETRSCFAFSSIATAFSKRSDTSRITLIELVPDRAKNKLEKWEETKRLYFETITTEWVERFQSRTVSMLPVILKNAAVFSRAVSASLDNQRTGDQLGIIFAGYYSLRSDNIISYEKALEIIKSQDLTSETLSNDTRDEVKLINLLMNSEINVEGYFGKITRTIGEIVVIARGDLVAETELAKINSTLANDTLLRIGMRVKGNDLIISDNSEKIRKLLENTAYEKNYYMILRRIDGAVKLSNTTFGGYVKSNATKIDTLAIFGNHDVSENNYDFLN